MPGPTGIPPVVFDTPTLGRAVRLGELYDQHSGKFLGVQLYPQSKVQEVVTDIRNTDLSVSLSTTHEEKASLLDINANLSLDVLSGLVKVSGSASYLRDEKSNTHEYAYALALKVRLSEKRILFAEDELGHNVLSVAQEDYITTNLATHFVSAIVYGGNFIVNLVAKQSEMSKEEKIEGKLQASFDKLKGAISLEGSVEAKIKGGFKDMNDKFDLVIHGDVALSKVPINPQDVLETFPEAASLISDNGGVPISVTLQPIPPKIYKGGLVYQLESDFVDDVLKAYSMLNDLSSRFLVLQNNAKRNQDFVPELARTVRVVAGTYTKEHSELLHKLQKFLQEYQQGKKPDPGTVFASQAHPSAIGGGGEAAPPVTVASSDITGQKVLDTAAALYQKHLDPTLKDEKVSTQYPASLAGLENELTRFRDMVSDIQKVRKSLQHSKQSSTANDAVGSSFYLSGIDDVSRAIRIQDKIPLFIMTPMTSGDQSNPDLAIIKYLAILRKNAAYFKDSTNPAYMFYAENLSNLEHRLPNGGNFAKLAGPSLFIGKVDTDGNLTWVTSDVSPPTPDPSGPGSDLTFPLRHKPDSDSIGHIAFSLDPVDGTQTFSLQIQAKQAFIPSKTSSATVLRVEQTKDETLFLVFQIDPLYIQLEASSVQLGLAEKQSPKAEAEFMGTFVQDAQNRVWILYLNDQEIARKTFTDGDLHPDAKKLQLRFGKGDKWWRGELYQFKAYKRALTLADVKDQYAKWKQSLPR